MLENVETHELQREVFRYSVIEEADKHFATTLGLDDHDLEEIAFPNDQASTAPKKQFRRRFTNGEFKVFYTAFELQTAEAEIRHHLTAWAAGNTKPTPYHYSGSRMVFTGLAKDLRRWPILMLQNGHSCRASCDFLPKNSMLSAVETWGSEGWIPDGDTYKNGSPEIQRPDNESHFRSCFCFDVKSIPEL